MLALDDFQTHEFAHHPVETHAERRGRGIEVCTRACKRFVYTWHKQMSELVHALRTSSGRLEQTNIHIPIPTELVDCWKQRHPRPIGQVGRRAVLPVSQYSHPGTGFVGRLEYVPPSLPVDQLEEATVLILLGTTKAPSTRPEPAGRASDLRSPFAGPAAMPSRRSQSGQAALSYTVTTSPRTASSSHHSNSCWKNVSESGWIGSANGSGARNRSGNRAPRSDWRRQDSSHSSSTSRQTSSNSRSQRGRPSIGTRRCSTLDPSSPYSR